MDEIRAFIRKYGDLSLLDENGNYKGNLTMSYCSSLTSVTFPEGMTIGGYLSMYYCSSLTSVKGKPKQKSLPTPTIWHWKDQKYIKADGIFQRLIAQRGNVYQVQNIGSEKVAYLVVGANNICAHGTTLHEAHDDI